MSKNSQERAAERVARDVGDNLAVNWDEHRGLGGELPPMLENLKIIAAVGNLHYRESTGSDGGLEDASTPAIHRPSNGSGPQPGPEHVPLFTWGHLCVLEKIGSGHYSDVYRALDPQLQCEVALKLRRADRPQDRRAEDRFLNEAQRLARIRHPNVVVVHGVDAHDGRVGIWMDLIRGKTLAEHVDEQGPLSPRDATLYGMDLSCALAVLHDAGIVHRDVKPSNVMIGASGKAVLMDLGSAGESPAADRHEPSPECTPLFAAPEVVVERRAAGPEADIYGLGALLYWCVSKRHPVEARELDELCDKHRRRELAPLVDVCPNLPIGLARIVDRALANDPKQRFGRAGEMHHALLDLLAPHAADEPRPRPSFARVAWVLGAIAIVALLGILNQRLHPFGFDVQFDLYRASKLRHEALRSGDAVATGDRLFMEVSGNKSMYVYVLSRDDVGRSEALFPSGGSTIGNPLSGRKRHRLPGTAMVWPIGSVANTETILAVASRHPVDLMETVLAKHQSVASDTTQIADGTRRVLPPEWEPSDPDELSRLERDLRGRKDVRVMTYQLRYR